VLDKLLLDVGLPAGVLLVRETAVTLVGMVAGFVEEDAFGWGVIMVDVDAAVEVPAVTADKDFLQATII
jgi:hypothetical protein